MRFLVDAQLPPRLAQALCGLGHEATHVAECGLETATDNAIWHEALARDATLITKDSDFVVLRVAKNAGPSIVWLRFGNCDTATLIARVVGSLDRVVTALERGEGIVEVVAS